MKNITQKARNLIERYNLGTPTEVYRTRIGFSIFFSLIFIIIGMTWTLVTAFIIDGPLFLIGQLSGQTTDPSISHIDPSLLPGQATSSPFSFGTDPFSILVHIFGIVFPLFGLIFVAVGLRILILSIFNRNNQAVVCTDGVAYATRKSVDAFRWEEVLMVFNRTFVSTNTTHNEHGIASTSTSVHHKYAVHCHDGRKFVFDDGLSNVEDLVERIEVEVARRRTMVM
jgi:hypothetical protein